MIIREAREGDYEALCALIEQVDQLHREQLPNIYQKADGTVRTREYILGLILAEDVGVYVAEQDGELLGFINLMVRMSSDIPILVPRCFALIENLCVDERYRRMGIGTALIEHAHHWAVERGATSVELTVYEFNQGAHAFYESLGYHTESRRMSREIGEQGEREWGGRESDRIIKSQRERDLNK